MNLYDFITLLQSNFDINQSTKTTFIQTMTAYTKRDTNERQDANANQSRTDSKCTAIFIYIWAEFLSRIIRVYGGRFQTADNARVYLWQNFRSA